MTFRRQVRTPAFEPPEGQWYASAASVDSGYWLSENPFLRRYMVRAQQPDGTSVCSPTAPGSWNAFTGNSGGFE